MVFYYCLLKKESFCEDNSYGKTGFLSSVAGFSRLFFGIRMRWVVFWHFFGTFIRNKRDVRDLYLVLRRLQVFASGFAASKFVRFNGGVRMGLYIPTFPGKLFLRASENMCGSESSSRLVAAVVSITTDCPYCCDYCYQRLDSGDPLSLETLTGAVQGMQQHGVALFILEGGEPISAFDRLLAVCGAIDERSEIWINTTGANVTRERLLALKGHGLTALKISVHHFTPDGHNRFLGNQTAWTSMMNAITLCRECAIPFAFNCRLTPEHYYDGSIEAILSLARDKGAHFVQFITPRSAGGNLGRKSISLSPDELRKLGTVIRGFNRSWKNRSYPSIFFDEYDERVIFGCTAGTVRCYLNAHGEVQPCQHINVTFGNVTTEPFSTIYRRMSSLFKRPGRCTACTNVASSVASHYTPGMKLPIPFTSFEREWRAMQWGDFCTAAPARNRGGCS